MSYQYAIYEKKEHIVYVTINRPEVMNALHAEANRELSEIFTDFTEDENAWIAILTGAGARAFSAGNDLKATAAATARGESMAAQTQSDRPLYFGGVVGLQCNKPIIAAVNGFALGGGFEIALACDLIIAAEHASFGQPAPRVGLIAGGGGVHPFKGRYFGERRQKRKQRDRLICYDGKNKTPRVAGGKSCLTA